MPNKKEKNNYYKEIVNKEIEPVSRSHPYYNMRTKEVFIKQFAEDMDISINDIKSSSNCEAFFSTKIDNKIVYFYIEYIDGGGENKNDNPNPRVKVSIPYNNKVFQDIKDHIVFIVNLYVPYKRDLENSKLDLDIDNLIYLLILPSEIRKSKVNLNILSNKLTNSNLKTNSSSRWVSLSDIRNCINDGNIMENNKKNVSIIPKTKINNFINEKVKNSINTKEIVPKNNLNKEDYLKNIKDYVDSEDKNTLLKKITDYVDSEAKHSEKFIKPIFIFGEKGVGKSFFIKNKMIHELRERKNEAFSIEANNLEELKNEIYELTNEKKLCATFLKIIRKDRNITILFLTIIFTPFMGLLITSCSKINLSSLWSLGIVISSLTLFFCILTAIYIFWYPHSTKGKLTKSFKSLSKKIEDKKYFYLFIDDLNRVKDKNEVYKIYKFIDNILKNTERIFKKIIIIYVNEKQFFNKEDEENIKKYIGCEIIMTINDSIDDFMTKFQKGFDYIKNILKIPENFELVNLMPNFPDFIKKSPEKLHFAEICLKEFNLFINLNKNSEKKFKYLFGYDDQNEKKSIKLDIVFYIQMLFLNICFKETFVKWSEHYLNYYKIPRNNESSVIPLFYPNLDLILNKEEVDIWSKIKHKNINNKEDFINLVFENKSFKLVEYLNQENIPKNKLLINDFLEYFYKLDFFLSLFRGCDPGEKTQNSFFIFENFKNYDIEVIYETFLYGIRKNKLESNKQLPESKYSNSCEKRDMNINYLNINKKILDKYEKKCEKEKRDIENRLRRSWTMNRLLIKSHKESVVLGNIKKTNIEKNTAKYVDQEHILPQKEAIEKYEKAISIDESNINAYVNQGNALVKQGKLDEAIEEYEKAINIDETNINAYVNWGLALYKKEKFDEAIDKYEKAISIDERDINAYVNWGNVLSKQGKFNEAIEKYEKAISIDESNINAYVNQGNALGEQGKFNEAIDKYEKVISIDETNINAYVNWGNTLVEQGKLDEAIEKYEKALKIDPNNISALFDLGNIFIQQQKYQKAIKKYEEVIKNNDKYVKAYVNWGNVLSKQGKLDEAIEKYEKALKIEEGDIFALINLGASLGQQYKLDEAIEKYEKALKIDPTNISIYNFWAITLGLNDKLDEAIDKCEKALKIDQNDLIAKTLKSTLFELKKKKL